AGRSGRAAVRIVYGARHASARIYRKDLDRWRATPGVTLLECVEEPGEGWSGRIGHVGDLLEDALSAPQDFAAVCGPPAMMSLVANRLVEEGRIPSQRVYLAIERQMKCGLGT